LYVSEGGDMDMNLVGRIAVIVVGLVAVGLGATACKDQAVVFIGTGTALVGWAIPWFRSKDAAK
jgi:hypothetical protein